MSFKSPPLAVLAWLVLLLSCAWYIGTRLTVSADLTAFLPKAKSPTESLLVSQLRDGVASRLVLIAIEGGTATSRLHASKALAARLRTYDEFTYVNNGELEKNSKERAFLFNHRYLLSPIVTTPGYFSSAGLKAALQESLATLSSPAGGLFKTLLPRDPTGEVLRVAQLWTPASGPAMQDGIWASDDGKRALLIAETRAPGFEIEAQRHNQALIENAFAELKIPDARLLLSGPSIFAVQSRDRIHGDVTVLSILAFVLVSSILLVSYRSPRLWLLGMLPVISGIAAGVVAVALGFGTVHAITLGFGVTLIGEAIDYPTYLFTQMRPSEHVRQTVTRISPTLRLAILTTIFGNIALLGSSFTGLAQLGSFSIIGIAAAGLVTRWVLPRLVPEDFTFRRPANLAIQLEHWVQHAGSLRWPLILLAAISLLFIATQREHLWDNDLANLSPVDEESRRLDGELRREMGAADARYLLVVSGATKEAALRASEDLLPKLDTWVAEKTIAGFDLAARYLPSEATQKNRQNALPQASELTANLQAALSSLPFQPGLFQPFLDDVARAKSQPLLSEAALAGGGLDLKVRAMLFAHQDQWVALIPLRNVNDPVLLEREVKKLNRPAVTFFDLKAGSNQIINSYRGENLKLSGLGLAAIYVLLVIGLRSGSQALRVMVPAVFAVMVTVSLLALMGEKLSVFHMASLLLVVGIGLNYALFFNSLNRDDDGSTIFSLLVCNLTTLASFGVLYFSETPVLHGIGITVSLGAFLSLVFSAILARNK